MVGAVGGGNLRENREDPAPTVGVAVALRPNIAHFSPIAMRILCTPHASHLWGPYGFSNDAARRVATFIDKWIFLIETFLPVRRENPPN